MCGAERGRVAYAPFTAVLRQLVRDHGVAEVAALLGGRGTGELAGLLPEFGAPPADRDPDMARARLFELLLALLEALADRQPVVVVVEDVHWADRSTRDLLGFLARNLRHVSVLLVVTFRSDELHRTHPLRLLLAELDRINGVTRVELPHLSREQVEAQLGGILGYPPEPGVTNEVYERGGGVPLFTEALLNVDGTVSPGLPWSLRDLLLGAVKELPEQTQQVLRVATAGGAQVGHRLLAAVTGLDNAALAGALRPGVEANVIVADAGGYAFRHELIREAVQEDLLPAERIQAAAAFAQALDADPALSGDGMAVARLALYWRGADEYERALRAAWDAAASAGARFAFAEQLQMLEQVLELWHQVPGAAEHTGADHAGVIELTADAALWAGEPQRGLALVEAALGEVSEAGNPARRAALLLRRARLRRNQLLPGPVEDLQAALLLAQSPDRLRAEILGDLSGMLRDHKQDAERAAEEMLALGARLGDQECRTDALISLAQLSARKGHNTVAALQDAREAARRIGSAPLEVRAYGAINDVLEGRGEHRLAIQAAQASLARARQLGLARFSTVSIAANLAESLTSAGRWDEAAEVLEEALGLDPAPRGRAHLLVLRGHDTAARIIDQLGRCPTAPGPNCSLRSQSPGWQQRSSWPKATSPQPWPPRAPPLRGCGAPRCVTYGRCRVTCGHCWLPVCGPAPRPPRSICHPEPILPQTCGQISNWRRRTSRAQARWSRPIRRHSPLKPPAPPAARTRPPGMPPPTPGTLSASRTHWPTHCCGPPPRHYRSETETPPPSGCSAPQNSLANSAPGRCCSRSRGWPGGPASRSPAGPMPRRRCRSDSPAAS